MKAIGFLFSAFILVGCTTLTEEDRNSVDLFDKAVGGVIGEEDVHAFCVLAGYITLSEEERATLGTFKTSPTLTDLGIKRIRGYTAENIKLYRDALTPREIKFITRGGFGYDPKHLNEEGVRVDPKHLNTRQKAIVGKLMMKLVQTLVYQP